MTALYFLLIAGICFLYTLNLFLRGSKKQQVEAVLGILIIFSVVGSFFILGWRWGLLALISPFVFVGLFRSVAEKTAFRLLGYRTGVDDDPAIDFENMMEEIGEEDKIAKQRLENIAKSPDINFVLSRHGVSFGMYLTILQELRASSLRDLAWEIVSSPTELDQLLEMRNTGKSASDIRKYFRNLKR